MDKASVYFPYVTHNYELTVLKVISIDRKTFSITLFLNTFTIFFFFSKEKS